MSYEIRRDEFGDYQILCDGKHVSWHPTMTKAVEKLAWIAEQADAED